MRLRVGANNPPTPYDRKCKDRWVELAFPEPTSTEVLTYWSEWLVASGDMPASELQDFLEQARQLEEQP
jgi:hypothetical protein